MEQTIVQNNTKPQLGDPGYLNKNCWLVKNLNYNPYKRCQYCSFKYRNCLFLHYQTISLILIVIFLVASYFVEGKFSSFMAIAVFSITIIYGYFFNKSTESIIRANFEQKRAADALEELTKHLQQKVDEQTKDIKAAFENEKKVHEELKQCDEAKSQFMIVTQHHLRTPLTSMMGYLDLMLAGTFGKVPPKQKAILKKLETSTQSEIKIVNDLLNVSGYLLGRETMKLEEDVNIIDLIDGVISDLTMEAKKKDIYLKFNKPKNAIKIHIDTSKIKIALTNIIDNAVKYTPKGGVSVGLENKGEKLLIFVKDTGIGISQESLNNLFKQAFQRGEEAKRMFAVGRGIGMFLSGKIIEAHKGRVWAESDGEGKGSTFFVELPSSNKK